MTRNEKTKYKQMAIGAVVALLVGAFLPDEYNPVEMIKAQFGGVQ